MSKTILKTGKQDEWELYLKDKTGLVFAIYTPPSRPLTPKQRGVLKSALRGVAAAFSIEEEPGVKDENQPTA